MKKVFVLIITIATILVISVTLYARDGLVVIINEIPQTFLSDSDPFIENGRILIPLGFISERFSCTVNWDSNAKIAEIVYGSKKMLFKNDDVNVIVDANGTQKNVELDVPSKIYNNRMFIPLRFMVDNIGAEIKWDPNSKTVSITSDKVFKNTNRWYDKLMVTGEYVQISEDKETGFKVARPKDGNANYIIIRQPACIEAHPYQVNGVWSDRKEDREYIQYSDIHISLSPLDLYTRHKVRDLLKIILPSTWEKVYDYLMLAIREEIFELPGPYGAFAGINNLYFENRDISIGKNGISVGIDIGMDGVIPPRETYTSSYAGIHSKSSGYDWQVKEYQLDQY